MFDKKEKPYIPCIYVITNKINGNQYVGQTIDPVRRWGEHQYPSIDEFTIQHAVIKYGPENFTFHIIEQPDHEDKLNEAEMWWVAYLDTYHHGYNETEGGDGIRGYQHTEEDKKKMSEIRLALIASGWETAKHTEEWKEQISKSMKGHKRNLGKKHASDCGHCVLLRERNANNNPALHMTDATKQKMSDKKKGSKNNNAIMTEEKVIELRKLAADGISSKELSSKFGISVRNVKGIIARNSWKHI